MEVGVATDLLEAGVPREDIVLGFQPPEFRQYSEFAGVSIPTLPLVSPSPAFEERPEKPAVSVA